ncbi:MAG: N-acetylneuraminate synthase family protein, partial [Bacteroidetes bacterium]|nr:N-acetylneuraminate synthase family protein [Bacteroidota bacterium]
MKTIADFIDGDECLIIAEIAQAHEGSVGIAHSYIDAVAGTGAHAVKFQTHIAEAESTHEDRWRVEPKYINDKNRFDYWKRMEFTPEQWSGLKHHAEEKGLIFLSSAFSHEAVELLEKLGMQAWKIASGEISNDPMNEVMMKTGKPFLISSGMSDMDELERLVNKIKQNKNPFAVLQCTSSYPTKPEEVGINMLEVYKEKFNCKVGLSDHSGTIYPSLAGVVMGMNVVEVHVTFNKQMFGFDAVASLSFEEMKQLVDGIQFIEKMKANPMEKNSFSQTKGELRNLFTKSIVAAKNLTKG